jgi:hypothetical protein
MKRTLLLNLSSLALAAHVSIGASAAQETLQIHVSDAIAPVSTSWARTVSVPRFDPGLGALQSIRITLTADIHGIARVESFDSMPTQVSLQFECLVSLQRPDSSDLVISHPMVNFLDSLAAYDGVADYGGTSGITHGGIDAAQETTVSVLSDSADFALFCGGAGRPGTIALPLTAIGTSVANGGGNLHTQFAQTASATADVYYTYVPYVPPHFTTCVPTRLASVGVPMTFQVCAEAGVPDDTVTLSVLDMPLGAHTSDASPVAGNTACSTFTWTPTLDQVGNRLVTFVATNSHQQTTTCTTAIVAAECHMLFSFGSGNAEQVLFGHLYDTQLVGLRRSFPVSMESIPSFPFRYLPAHCYVQVVAYNPYSFPSNPSLWSQAVHIIKDRVHQSIRDEYSGTMNGIGIRAEVYEENGQRRVRFPFHVQGL